MSPWSIWLIITAVLLILELLGCTVALLCLAVGTFAAMIASLIGAELVWQSVACGVVTIAAFVLLAPAVKRFYNGRNHRHSLSNMDALIGRTGTVTGAIAATRSGMGRVRIDGDSWQAVTDAPQTLTPGQIVTVLAYDSIVLTVKPSTEIKP